MFMSIDVAQRIMDHGLYVGANFCELYIEKSNNQSLKIKNEEVHSLTGGIDFGIGVRLLFGTEVLYGYLNSIHLDDVVAVVDQHHLGRRERVL